MDQRVSLITLGVSNMTRSAAFYAALGWRQSSASVEGEVVFFDAGGVVVALFGADDLAHDAGIEGTPTGFARIALAHNVSAREDVDRVLGAAACAGAAILRPGKDADWGGYSGYFADPDQHIWEVAWNPHLRNGPDGRVQLP